MSLTFRDRLGVDEKMLLMLSMKRLPGLVPPTVAGVTTHNSA